MLRTLGILIAVQAVSLLIPSENDCHRLLLAMQIVVSIYLICSIVTHEVEPHAPCDRLNGFHQPTHIVSQQPGPPISAGLMDQYSVLQFLQQVEERRQNRRDCDSYSLW